MALIPYFKLGHKASDYYAKRNSQQNIKQKAGSATETAFLANKKDKTGGWCLDSGCTSHLYSDKVLFVDIRDISSGLRLANNITIKVEAMGDVKVKALVNKEERRIRIKDTLYVPDLKTNLLSVAKIVDNQHQVLFTKDQAIVRDPQGHMNTKDIALMWKTQAVNGLKLDTDATSINCEHEAEKFFSTPLPA
ncbi:uncharacterized protein LOC116853307 [Odontomachus brunneus]|uniref:uncharacterized protein LOC116853307 n=1 Tax=Odontomachus brunneus TaxID=486640 RepID=UPI0013F19CD1|nr:uncharacterized protein LOC116853307 [Odontomachus brunneus]